MVVAAARRILSTPACQLGVSLSVATRTAHVPIDFELYLPESWTSDDTRREECKVPADVIFKTKEDLALDMITRAVENRGYPHCSSP